MTAPVRIPADVEMSDRVLGSLTARQLAVLATTGLVLYAVWTVTMTILPLPVFLAAAGPVMAAAAVLALGRRDGVSMDKLAFAAVAQRKSPRRYATTASEAAPPPAWLLDAVVRHNTGAAGGRLSAAGPLPARQVGRAEASADVGVIDLGPDGLAAVAAASTVNFALRTPQEQESLVALFGRYLHSLTAPVQILARTHRLDLTDQIADLRAAAPELPHPALRSAALDHADFLDDLARHANLLRRQILLVLREAAPPGAAPARGSRGLLGRLRGRDRSDAGVDGSARRAAEARLGRRLLETVELLAPAGIVVTPLSASQATAVLRSACNPDCLLPPTAPLADPRQIISGRAPIGTDAAPDPVTDSATEWDEDEQSRPPQRLGARATTSRRSA